jgi:Na+-driven multidrug efflux pump
VICKEVVNKQELMRMKVSSLMVNIAVLVFFSPQQILDFYSANNIQRTIETAAPWFQVVAASFTIVKHGTEFLEKQRNTENSDGD